MLSLENISHFLYYFPFSITFFFPFFFQLLLMAKKERKNHQGRVEARVERGKEENIQLKQKDVSAPVSINWQGFLVAVTDMT